MLKLKRTSPKTIPKARGWTSSLVIRQNYNIAFKLTSIHIQSNVQSHTFQSSEIVQQKKEAKVRCSNRNWGSFIVTISFELEPCSTFYISFYIYNIKLKVVTNSESKTIMGKRRGWGLNTPSMPFYSIWETANLTWNNLQQNGPNWTQEVRNWTTYWGIITLYLYNKLWNADNYWKRAYAKKE